MTKTVETGNSRNVHGNMTTIRPLVRLHIPIITAVDVVGNIIIRSRIKERTGMENHLRRTWISVLAISWQEGLVKEWEMIILCFDDNTKVISQCFTVTVVKDT